MVSVAPTRNVPSQRARYLKQQPAEEAIHIAFWDFVNKAGTGRRLPKSVAILRFR